MKRHLNTLFVTTEGAYLKKDGQAVVVSIEKENKLRLPLNNLDGIVCFGNIMCSPYLMGACAKAGVSISFLTMYGGFIAAVNGYSPGNVLLRREQYRWADTPEQTLKLAQHFVAAKISNSRNTLLRAARDTSNAESKTVLQTTAKRIAPQRRSCSTVNQSRFITRHRRRIGQHVFFRFQPHDRPSSRRVRVHGSLTSTAA